MINNQCSGCGKNTDKVRYVACGAVSKWAKYTTLEKQFEKQDDLKVWKISLCDGCLPASYGVFLGNTIKKSRPMFIASIVVFSCAMLLLFSGPYEPEIVRKTLSSKLTPFFIVFFLLASLFGLIFSLYQITKSKNRLKKLTQDGDISEEEIKHCFQGEGERIIKILENRGKPTEGRLWGDFSLPKFKQFAELFTNGEQKKDYFEITNEKQRRIVGVASSMEDMEKEILATWKPLLNLQI